MLTKSKNPEQSGIITKIVDVAAIGTSIIQEEFWGPGKWTWHFENSKKPGCAMIRKKYRQQLLPLLQEINLVQHINATQDFWISSDTGISGIQNMLSNTKTCARILLGIVSSNKEINKVYFWPNGNWSIQHLNPLWNDRNFPIIRRVKQKLNWMSLISPTKMSRYTEITIS